MRQRNIYGMAGTPNRTTRPVPAPRRPVTQRGRAILESSRRKQTPRDD